jgi:hypothetical protein
MDTYNHRRQKSLNARADYQLTPATRLSLLTLYVDHSEVFRRQYETRAYTGSQTQNTVPGPATSIVPGFTNRITQVRPVPTSTIDVTMTGPNNFFNRLRRADLGLEHTRGPLVLEAAVRHTRTRINIGNGEGAVLTNRLTGTGWILDRTRSDLYPAFLPNGGTDFTLNTGAADEAVYVSPSGGHGLSGHVKGHRAFVNAGHGQNAVAVQIRLNREIHHLPIGSTGHDDRALGLQRQHFFEHAGHVF